MYKPVAIVVLGILMVSMGCGGGIELSYTEPTEGDGMLVVGRILLETGTTLSAGIYQDKMSVAIVGKTENGKTIGYWTKTDVDGYYAFANVPRGSYMVKTIKATVRDLGVVTITSRLTGGNNFYYLSSEEYVAFSGDYFPFEPIGRIVDLQHMIVHLEDPDMVRMNVQTNFLPELEAYESVTGEVLNADPVPQYFIKNYPDSAWKPDLEKVY